MQHLLIECAYNQGFARGFIRDNKILPDKDNNFWPSILSCESKEIAIKSFHFISNCLRARKFALEEEG
jgi:hypothetical protein